MGHDPKKVGKQYVRNAIIQTREKNTQNFEVVTLRLRNSLLKIRPLLGIKMGTYSNTLLNFVFALC